jgi:hypothetical protein
MNLTVVDRNELEVVDGLARVVVIGEAITQTVVYGRAQQTPFKFTQSASGTPQRPPRKKKKSFWDFLIRFWS